MRYPCRLSQFLSPLYIEQLNALLDDERHDAKPQALLEHNEPPDADVSVLERVESRVECHDILEGFRRTVFVIRKEPAYFRVDVPGERSNRSAASCSPRPQTTLSGCRKSRISEPGEVP